MNIPPKEYFQMCVTQYDYHTMDLSDYGPNRWPSSWSEHVKLARISRKMEKKYGNKL